MREKRKSKGNVSARLVNVYRTGGKMRRKRSCWNKKWRQRGGEIIRKASAWEKYENRGCLTGKQKRKRDKTINRDKSGRDKNEDKGSSKVWENVRGEREGGRVLKGIGVVGRTYGEGKMAGSLGKDVGSKWGQIEGKIVRVSKTEWRGEGE